MATTLVRLLKDQRGASAVEFVIVLPLLALLLIGAFYVCFMMYAYSTLHYAVEDAARCRSVKTAVSTNATTTQTYAGSRFRGWGITPTFVATQPACGNQVVGSGTFTLRTGLRSLPVPMSATACYPLPG
jgi:Flp pilus assembly protein TadG